MLLTTHHTERELAHILEFKGRSKFTPSNTTIHSCKGTRNFCKRLPATMRAPRIPRTHRWCEAWFDTIMTTEHGDDCRYLRTSAVRSSTVECQIRIPSTTGTTNSNTASLLALTPSVQYPTKIILTSWSPLIYIPQYHSNYLVRHLKLIITAELSTFYFLLCLLQQHRHGQK